MQTTTNDSVIICDERIPAGSYYSTTGIPADGPQIADLIASTCSQQERLPIQWRVTLAAGCPGNWVHGPQQLTLDPATGSYYLTDRYGAVLSSGTVDVTSASALLAVMPCRHFRSTQQEVAQ